METLSASHIGITRPNQARTAEGGNITKEAVPGGTIVGGISQAVVVHGRISENGKIKDGTIKDRIIHSGTIQIEPIQCGTSEAVVFKDGNIQSKTIQTETFHGPNFNIETGSETTRVRKDATPIKLGGTEVIKGPVELRKGPTKFRKCSTEPRNGPTEVRKGPTQVRKGSIELRKGPTEVRKGPTEVRKGSMEAGKGTSQLGRNPNKQRIRATKDTEPTIKINNDTSGVITCTKELRNDATDRIEKTSVDSKEDTKIGEEIKHTITLNDVKQPSEPMRGERTEEANKKQSFQHVNNSSPFEEDVVYGPEANLREHYDNCLKNPRHEQFIPFTSFGPQHLPARYHKKSVFELVKTLGELTVKLSVYYVSHNRPETFNGKPYPRYIYRGQKRFALGTGRVVQVKKFTMTDGQTCPCATCKQTSAVQEWAQIRVATATHVVFDDEEAKHTTVSFGCDSDTSQVTTIEGTSAKADIEGDVSNLFCVTHDLDFAANLATTAEKYKRLSQKVFKKYENNKEEEKLVIIVSHPHGCPKQVSVGQWTKRTDIVKEEFTTVYIEAEQDDYQDDDYNDPYENYGFDDYQYNEDDRNYDDYDDQYYEEYDRTNDDYDDQYYEEYDRTNNDYDDQYNEEDDRNNNDYDDQYNEEDDRNNDDYDDQYNEEDDRNNDDYDDQYNEEYDRNNDDYEDQYNDDDVCNHDDYDDQYNDDDVCNHDDYDDQYNDDDDCNHDDYDESYNDDNYYPDDYDNDYPDDYDNDYPDDYDNEFCVDDFDDLFYSIQKLVNSYTCSKYLYTACTCPGSSGATVFLFGRDDWTTDHLHSTGTADGNLSGYAFKQEL